jgi:hypothetical protein
LEPGIKAQPYREVSVRSESISPEVVAPFTVPVSTSLVWGESFKAIVENRFLKGQYAQEQFELSQKNDMQIKSPSNERDRKNICVVRFENP